MALCQPWGITPLQCTRGSSAYFCNDGVIEERPSSTDVVWENCFLGFYASLAPQPGGDHPMEVDGPLHGDEVVDDAASAAVDALPQNDAVTLPTCASGLAQPAGDDPMNVDGPLLGDEVIQDAASAEAHSKIQTLAKTYSFTSFLFPQQSHLLATFHDKCETITISGNSIP